MKPTRRYLTFSLRTFFFVLTAFAVWLGVIAERAREQREAVRAIGALGRRKPRHPEIASVSRLVALKHALRLIDLHKGKLPRGGERPRRPVRVAAAEEGVQT